MAWRSRCSAPREFLGREIFHGPLLAPLRRSAGRRREPPDGLAVDGGEVVQLDGIKPPLAVLYLGHPRLPHPDPPADLDLRDAGVMGSLHQPLRPVQGGEGGAHTAENALEDALARVDVARFAVASDQAVAALHLHVTAVGLFVQAGIEMAVEERDEEVAEAGAAGHPLVVVTAAVMIGAIQLGARHGFHQPEKERLVVGVHPQRDLGLLPVAAKMPLADEKSHEDAAFKVSQRGRPSGFSIVRSTDLGRNPLNRPTTPFCGATVFCLLQRR